MLKNLDKTKLPITIGKLHVYLRYNLTAMRYLEEYYKDINSIMGKDIENMGTDDILHLLRAGLIDCFYDKNKEAIEKREFDKILPTLAELGHMLDDDDAQDIALQIVHALLDSMPQAPVGAIKKKKAARKLTLRGCIARLWTCLKDRKASSGIRP